MVNLHKSQLFDQSPARTRLFDEIASREIDMKELSTRIGRNHAYVQQYLKRGIPRILPEDARELLADALAIDQDELRDIRRAEQSRAKTVSSASGRQGMPRDSIPEMDVTAGLGGGGELPTVVETANGLTVSAEVVRDYWRLPQWLMGAWGGAQSQHVACFATKGDSMAPAVQNGDVVFADLRHRVPSPPGIYVLADAFGGIVVKRLEVVSKPDEEPVCVRVWSENPQHGDDVWTLDELHIIGRFLGRFTAF